MRLVIQYREQAIQELEKEFLREAKESKKGPKGGALKFIEKSNENSDSKLKEEAGILIQKLKNDEDLEDLLDENMKEDTYEGRIKIEKSRKSKYENDLSKVKPKENATTASSLKKFLQDSEPPIEENPSKKTKLSTGQVHHSVILG